MQINWYRVTAAGVLGGEYRVCSVVNVLGGEYRVCSVVNVLRIVA